MEKNNSKPKRKFRKIKVGYIFAFIIIIAFVVLVLKLVLPSNGNGKYGDRLDDISENKITSKEEKKLIKNIKDREEVKSCEVDIQGKIINVIFTVKSDVSKEAVKVIAAESLGQLSDKVKGYYDIQFMVKKEKEEGTKVTDEEGNETVKYEFPIMGYKNKKRSDIIW